MILLLSHQNEFHANQIVRDFEALGFHDYARVDCGLLVRQQRLEIRAAGSACHWSIRPHGEDAPRVDHTNCRTIWWHRPSHPGMRRQLLVPDRQHLDDSQAFSAIQWLVDLLPESMFPLNPPATTRAAQNKHQQLAVAAAVGFEVLATLYSTDPAALAEFAKRCGAVVVKTIGQQSFVETDEEGNDLTHTFGARVFNADDLVPHLESVEETQLYLQQAVDKVAEHRITVLPGEVIDCRFDTTALPPGEIDYRGHFRQLPKQVVDVPAPLEGRLRDYLKRMGLRSGCFDFAERADGSLVFFECNPAGEWLWIQRATGVDISGAVARRLIEHHEAADG